MTTAVDDLMTDLVARIEAGTPPWRQPWSTGASEPGLPRRATGEPFSGSNAWTLAFASALAGYAAPYWFTFRQALAIGAPVRRGERSTPALLYKTGGGGDAEEDGEDRVRPDRPEEAGRIRRYLKVYAVFNAEQLRDCPEHLLGGPPVDPEVRRAAQDAALDAVPAEIVLAGLQAYYDLSRDVVVLPPPERFDTVDDFRSTRAHELVHWTGAPRRLDRAFGARFGDAAYAFEELVAEIGSALLGLTLGLPPQRLDDHAAYLTQWTKLLHDRPHALWEASGHAQRAVDHLTAYGQAVDRAEAA